MAIMDLFTSLQTIINERSAKKVRQSIHDGIFRANQVVDANKNLVDQVAIRQDAVEQYNDQMIAEMTDKDVISAPELIEMRDGEATANQRLERDYSDINNRIDHIKDDVPIVVKLSQIPFENLNNLTSDYYTKVWLDVDIDLNITTPLELSNATLRTNNGSKILISNESYLLIKDKTDIQDFEVISTNKSVAPFRIKKSDEGNPADFARILIDNIDYVGDPDFTCDIFDIYGSAKGMYGLTIRNIYGSDASVCFNFLFEDASGWTNGNVFSDIFIKRVKRLVKYNPVANHVPRTHFVGNMFRNLQGNGSGIYIDMAEDVGLNRYINCWVYDVEVYNNLPELNKMGRINGVQDGYYLTERPEYPLTLVMRDDDRYYRLGYFVTSGYPVAEHFLKFNIHGPTIAGIRNSYYLARNSDGSFIGKRRLASNIMTFYSATLTDGSVGIFVKYTGISWVKPAYYERIGFQIDHMGGMAYDAAAMSNLTLVPITVTHDEAIL